MINCNNLFWAPTDIRERKRRKYFRRVQSPFPPLNHFTISGNYVSTAIYGVALEILAQLKA